MYTDSAKVARLSGEEPFRGDGPRAKLIEYWRWSGSSLVDNTARGMLAEFLVAAALGVHIHPHCPRIEWEPYDLQTGGVTIEVKSAATVQSWPQKGPSQIQFGCVSRQADIYVFCIWRPDNPLDRRLAGDDTLNVDEWTFYILRTAKVPKQKRIGENSLLKLEPTKCCYSGLRDAIKGVAAELTDERR